MADECPLCSKPDVFEPHPELTIMTQEGDRVHDVVCPTCGHFEISGLLFLHHPDNFENNKYLLSAMTRLRSYEGTILRISSSSIPTILDEAKLHVPQNPFDEMNLILKHLERRTGYSGEWIHLSVENDYPIAFAKNKRQFEYLLGEMVKQEYLYRSTTRYQISAKGWQRIDTLKKTTRETNKVFVAMWLDDEMDLAYEKGFAKALTGTGYEPIRIDKKHFEGKICDHIIAEIQKSGLLVSDFTANRGSV